MSGSENILCFGYFRTLTLQEQIAHIQKGRPTPALPGLTCGTSKGGKLQFSTTWYSKASWLTGCERRQTLLCFPCALFSDSKDVWTFTGFSDIKNLGRGIQRHEKSREHLDSSLKLTTLGKKEYRIDLALNEAARVSRAKHNEQIKQNRRVLSRLVDIVCLLGRQELAFRGHDESETSSNQGNYSEVFKLIMKRDKVLQTHLNNSKAFTGLSKTIQNDLIDSVAYLLKKEIEDEVQKAEFFAVEADESSDISLTEHCSIILRYVDPCGYARERFFGFFNISADRTANALYSLLDQQLEPLNYGGKLVAQSYDGAAVMAGELNGLQEKIKQKAKQALFVNCHAHNLNLVLSQSCSNITACRVFFASIRCLPAFVNQSSKRMEALNNVAKLKLPKDAHTRWNLKSHLVESVKLLRESLLTMFTEMLEENSMKWDDATIREAGGYIRLLENFEFNFMLSIFSEVFSKTSILVDILQTKANDIDFCVHHVSKMIELLKKSRSDAAYEQHFKATVNDTGDAPSKVKRRRHETEDSKSYFRQLYFSIIDTLTTQMEVRFEDLKKLSFLKLLDAAQFESFSKTFPTVAFTSLLNSFPDYFDSESLKNELIVFYTSHDLLQNCSKLQELLVYFVKEDIYKCLPNVHKLASLLATLPVSTASVERSFSALKRIKTYCRNTVGQDRLSSLALMSIEKELLLQLEKDPKWYDEVMEHFATAKQRRAEFFYQ